MNGSHRSHGTSSGGAGSAGGDGKSLVLAATDIVELVGQTVALKRRGKDFVGLCPFHQEKTPSFKVDPAKQFFYCFGCKAAGNAIEFVIKRDRVEFREALRYLAQRANIELPRLGVSKEKTSERQVLLEAHSAACALFEKFLADPVTGKAARDYLESRGFTAESIKRFQIGCVPEAWDALLRSPLLKKFTPQQLQLAGLVKARDNGGGFYDTFRNRLMFPIRDEQGRVIAFGGRVMPGSQDPAKYLNSPETPLFSKSRCVFGLDLARQKIVETRTVAVVEGYTDVVMAHQFGASNVVSVLGTAMTEHHVSILRRFADRIVLLFDADSAGDLAVNRAVELFLTQPVEILIASMPEGIDPDEFLLAHGAEGFQRMLADASDALTYKWKQLSREFQSSGDLTARQRAVSQYLELLAGARGSGPIDPIRWGAALSRVSRLIEIPAEELNRRFKVSRTTRGAWEKKRTHRDAQQPVAPSVVKRGEDATDRAEIRLLGVLLVEPNRWHDVQQRVQPKEFSDALRRELATIYWNFQRDEGEPIFSEFLDLLQEGDLKTVAIRAVEEVQDLQDRAAQEHGIKAEVTLEKLSSEALAHWAESRRRSEKEKLVAELRRTSVNPATGDGGEGVGSVDQVDEVALLKQLQEQARRADLRRV